MVTNLSAIHMRTSITLVCLILYPFLAYNQSITATFEKSDPIQEGYSATNQGYTDHTVKLTIKRETTIPKNDIPILIANTDLTANSEDYLILNPNIVVTSAELNSKDEIIKNVYLRIYKDSTGHDKADEVFLMSIKIDTTQKGDLALKSAHFSDKAVVTIKDAKAPVVSSILKIDPFRITVGANFDFESTEPASFYFEGMAHYLNTGKVEKYKRLGMGFYGSLYNNRFLSKDSIVDSKDFHSLISAVGDTVDLVRNRYQIGTSSTIKNIGGEIGILWGWSNTTDSLYVSHAIILPEFAATQRRINTTYSYTKIESDTLYGVALPDTINQLIERSFDNYRYDEFLLGIGYIGRYIDLRYGELTFKMTSGIAVQKGQSTIYPYYTFRCQLLDPKVHVNLGVEVRGYYGRSNPFFGIYLSKSFSLKKLTEY